jgi:hypothetical protein
MQGHPEALSIGFWQSPKRFNVAITRAKALLVVVGSPTVLSREPYWRQLLRHAAARGAYRGAGLREMERLLRGTAAAGGSSGPAWGGGDGGGGEEGGEAGAGKIQLPDEISEWTGAGGTGGAAAGYSGDYAGDRLGAAAGEGGMTQHDQEELAAAATQIAELAYLGLGDSDKMYYETLEEYYNATSGEQQFRVVL